MCVCMMRVSVCVCVYVCDKLQVVVSRNLKRVWEKVKINEEGIKES